MAACTGAPHPTGRLDVRSPDFPDGGTIPVRFTCDGVDRVPVVEWSGGSNGDQMVLEMTDTDADGFVHWLLYDFGGASGRLGGSTTTGTEGRNDFGTNGYRGPCPPPGDAPHRYVITLTEYRPVPSPMTAGERPDEVAPGDPVARGTLTGTYVRR
jgi:hypothetical protein